MRYVLIGGTTDGWQGFQQRLDEYCSRLAEYDAEVRQPKPDG
jgi:hypothetical protein